MKCLSSVVVVMVACVCVHNVPSVAGAPSNSNIKSDTGIFVRDIMDSLSTYLTGLFSEVGNIADSYISPGRRDRPRRPYYPEDNINLRDNTLKHHSRPNKYSSNGGNHGNQNSNVNAGVPLNDGNYQGSQGNYQGNQGSQGNYQGSQGNYPESQGNEGSQGHYQGNQGSSIDIRAPFTDVNVRKQGNKGHQESIYQDGNEGNNGNQGSSVDVRAPFTDVNVRKQSNKGNQGSYTDGNESYSGNEGSSVDVRAPFTNVNVKKEGNEDSSTVVRAPFTNVNVKKEGYKGNQGSSTVVRAPFTDVKVDKYGQTSGVNVRAPFVDVQVGNGATKVKVPFTDLFLQYKR